MDGEVLAMEMTDREGPFAGCDSTSCCGQLAVAEFGEEREQPLPPGQGGAEVGCWQLLQLVTVGLEHAL